MSRHRLFPLATDSLAWPVGIVVGAVLKLATGIPGSYKEILAVALLAMTIQGAVGRWVGIYRHRWRFTSFEEISALGATWLTATVVVMVTNYAFRARDVSQLPSSAVATGAITTAALIGLSRAVWRRYWEERRRPSADRGRRTLIFGAGDTGQLMVRAMLTDPTSEYVPVAILDDRPARSVREIQGVPVVGTRHDLAEMAERYKASAVLVAMSRADAKLLNEIAALAAEARLDLRVVPSTSELVGGMTVADVRPPTVDDLLGRDPVDIDLATVSEYLTGRRVLVTGAGGSIGSEIARQVAKFDPARLYLLDRDETGLHGVQLSLEGRALLDTEELIVADIRDRDRMFELFAGCEPEVVFHAAALKHLTLLENHPMEAVKTNTIGTRNVLEAARSVGVTRFVNVSTDKAANPTSVLGATKLAAEHLTAHTAAETGLPYVSVRFGNVLGSRGSVLPTFLEQIKNGGPLTVTDRDATRFFMTIPEAARLVVQAGAIGSPGEKLILDMGEPVRILDLAQQLINLLRPGTPIEFTGLRPGEKMHEVVVATDEVAVARHHPRVMHAAASEVDPLAAFVFLDNHVRAAAGRLVAPGRNLRSIEASP